jgi:hypothetical protein
MDALGPGAVGPADRGLLGLRRYPQVIGLDFRLVRIEFTVLIRRRCFGICASGTHRGKDN